MGSKRHTYTDSKGDKHLIFEQTDGEGGRMYSPYKTDGNGMGVASDSKSGAQEHIEQQIEKGEKV
jgi:hypothetical protein